MKFPPQRVLRRLHRQAVAALLGLGMLSGMLGCVPFQQPIRVEGNVTGQVLTTPVVRPLLPSFLPRRHVNPQTCLVAVVDVDGLLLNADTTGLGSWGENSVSVFRERLDAIEQNSNVRAVVLRINSPGGSVTATDIMWRDLQAFRQRSGLPVVACLMDVATGGAYYLATGTDAIVAHPTTVTGAIGCILNVYNLQDMLAQLNLAAIPIKAGKNIDLGSSIKPLDDNGRAMLQTMADEFHQRFRKVVTSARPQVDANLETTFDGRAFTATQAMELGLIDQIGYFDTALARAREFAGISSAELVFYRRQGDAATSPYSVTPNVPLQDKLFPINVPGLTRSRLPSFLYLWEMDPTVEAQPGK